MNGGPSVAVVGGGLAGLAAAVALRTHGRQVELFEACRSLGGRASSFSDRATGQLIDYCQHVSMGCCTNLADFCRRMGIDDCFRRYRVLHFIAADGKRYDVAAYPWLPAPLHLGPSLLGLKYLSLGERLGIGRAMWRLARTKVADLPYVPTMADWLNGQKQSARAIDQFWGVILVSALGESLDRVSLPAARKVLVDGFLAARCAYELLIPDVPLGELYGARLESRLAELGVRVHLGQAVREVAVCLNGFRLRLADGTEREFDAVVIALTWRQVTKLFAAELLDRLPRVAEAGRLESSPITGVHLWFDRPITSLPHAVLVGRQSQWLFARGRRPVPQSDKESGHYYQVVISASRGLAGRDHDELVTEIRGELEQTFPEARGSRLLHAQVVTEKAAVFSPRPGSDLDRPLQETPIKNLALAGDWTWTDWPSTMEGAVRSGYLAAEAILAAAGRNAPNLLVPDLPRGLLSWLLFGHR